MIMFPVRLLIFSAVGLVAHAVHAEEPAIIAKARAYLGAEADLAAVTSVHYVGTLVTADPADASKQSRAKVEIVFQKPYQQRITISYEKNVEITALDGFDGWQRQQDSTDSKNWRQGILVPQLIKRLRANTLENLYFYRGLEAAGVDVEDAGPVTIEGVACEKVSFTHGPGLIFTRFFDLATGHLVLTETEAGGGIRETGEMRAGGLRFPQNLVTTSKTTSGLTQTVTIAFEKITLNEKFPDDYFRFPVLVPRS